MRKLDKTKAYDISKLDFEQLKELEATIVHYPIPAHERVLALYYHNRGWLLDYSDSLYSKDIRVDARTLFEELNEFTHLMLDIETLGTESNSAILSIAAVEFDLVSGETGKTFYEKVDLQSCLDAGLKVNGKTLTWWANQSTEALKEVFSDEGRSLKDVLSDLKEFCKDKDYQVWGNSARFDCGIVTDAFRATGISNTPPWDFRKERCLRTLVSFAPEVKQEHTFEGVLHNALDDCLNQISIANKTYKKLIMSSI